MVMKKNWSQRLKISALRAITVNLRAWMAREENTPFRKIYYDYLNDHILPAWRDLEGTY